MRNPERQHKTDKMRRVVADSILILPPPEHYQAVQRLIDALPEEWKAVGAEPVPERFHTIEGKPYDTWPVGYMGWGFTFYPGPPGDPVMAGDPYVMSTIQHDYFDNPEVLESAWEEMLRRVRNMIEGPVKNPRRRKSSLTETDNRE